MFTKFRLWIYDVMFHVYGRVGRYYYKKKTKDPYNVLYYDSIINRCIEKRSDLLDKESKIKGLI